MLRTVSTAQESDSSKILLTDLLAQWQHDHDFQYSGRNEILKECLITKTEFNPELLPELLQPCKLSVTLNGEVYIISNKPREYLINGYLTDLETRVSIPNASVKYQEQGTITNEYGQFMLAVPSQEVTVEVSHVSYIVGSHRIKYKDDNLIEVEPKNIKLNEVVVGGSSSLIETLSDEDWYNRLMTSGIPVDAKFFRSLEETLASDHDTVLQEALLTARKRRYGIYYHRLDVDKKVGKSVGKVYGFSDGKEVYINPGKPRLRKRTDFYKVEQIDRFLHYKVVERITFPVAGGAPAVIEFPAEKLLDVETGKSKTLTRGRLRRLIADDIELIAAFNEEKKKSSKLKLYLETYYARKKER